MAALVLDLDGAVGTLADAEMLPLAGWQETLRFGCRLAALRRFAAALDAVWPAGADGPVFFGSGDFHHLSLPLIQRHAHQGPFDVVVLDNHPDNMRYPWGIHCGSWVRHVARLPFVRRVEVLGITSGDVGWRHAWENHLAPLARGRLRYWCTGVDVAWARRIGLGEAVLAFDNLDHLLARFAETQAAERMPVYLSIDKDVLSPEVARTNWDQGRMTEEQLGLALRVLSGRVIASDVTGEVSIHHYASRWKRWLSALDGQPTIAAAELESMQRGQRALNQRLIPRLQALVRP